MPITPSLRHCSNKYKLAREGEKDKEKDEDFEKVKVFFFFFQYYVARTRRQPLEERVGWVCVDRLNDG